MVLIAASIASMISCYPVYSQRYASSYNGDAKGYAVEAEPAPAPQPQRYGVDPGLVVAGVAAAGLLGYAIGHNNGCYYGPPPVYYRPVPYGRAYYAPRYHP